MTMRTEPQKSGGILLYLRSKITHGRSPDHPSVRPIKAWRFCHDMTLNHEKIITHRISCTAAAKQSNGRKCEKYSKITHLP